MSVGPGGDMRHASAVLVAALGMLSACGSEPGGPANSGRLVVTGTVRSSHTGTPIAGAFLTIYDGNAYSTFFGTVYDRDTSDAQGRYRLSTTYTGASSCAYLTISVDASGYYGYFFYPAVIQCGEEPQTIDIQLDPEPVQLIVSPKTVTLGPGERQRFQVFARFADSTTGPPPPYGGTWDVAWSVAGDSTCGRIFGDWRIG